MELEFKYRKSVVFKNVVLPLLCAVLVMSCAPLFNLPNEEMAIWWQRSGALAVAFCVVAEAGISDILNSLNLQKTIAEVNGMECLYEGVPRYLQILKYSAHALTILATLVWGYGDLMLPKFSGSIY
jgi:hypothetical protein